MCYILCVLVYFVCSKSAPQSDCDETEPCGSVFVFVCLCLHLFVCLLFEKCTFEYKVGKPRYDYVFMFVLYLRGFTFE